MDWNVHMGGYIEYLNNDVFDCSVGKVYSVFMD